MSTVVEAEATSFAGVTRTIVDTGTAARQYRIPAMAVTRSGAIVACCDRRNGSTKDLPNNIDIVCRRSKDNGATWEDRDVAVLHGEGDTPKTAYGVGDASLILPGPTS